MAELVAPTTRLATSWREARDEWPAGSHQDGTGIRLAQDLDLDSSEGFGSWVSALHRHADRSFPLPPTEVHSTFWWIVEDDRYLGGIDLRHYLNAVLLEGGGNIGYSIRPSARGQGLAGWALGQVLLRAGSFGLDRVLLVCHEGNHASARTIERNGGVLEDVRGTGSAAKRRYWRAVRP